MTISPTDSCAFLPCDQVERCCLTPDGACHKLKFPAPALHQDVLKKGARALAGTKPRPTRDPSKIQRKRKALR